MKVKLLISLVIVAIVALFINVPGTRSQTPTPTEPPVIYSSSVTVTCSGSSTYTGAPIEPCSATYTTTDGGGGSLPVTYSSNTSVGTATASATFAGDATHTGSSGSATFDITQASSSVGISCPGSVTYTGSAQTPCTAEATDGGLLHQSVAVSYSNNTEVGTATANASWDGDGNHTGSAAAPTGFAITQAPSIVTVTCPASVVYNGSAQTPCSASASGAGMSTVDVSGSLVYSNNTNAGGAGATASYSGDTSHTASAGGGGFTITPANASCSVQGYTGTYDGSPHGASGGCSGLNGENPGGLSLGASFTDVPGGTAHWSFTGNGNYNNASGDVSIVLSKANASCSIFGYSGTYDGSAKGASGSCTGAGGSLSLGDSFTDVPGGFATWNFTGGTNFNDMWGVVTIYIGPASATCTVNGFTGGYDGSAHGASGSCSGVGGELSGLSLGSSFINVPGGTAEWSFSYPNHEAQSGSVPIVITKVPSTVTVTCPASVTYNGSAQTPCTASATGAGMDPIDVSASLVYADNIDAGGATASAGWGGDDNHNSSTGSGGFTINKANASCSVSAYHVTYDSSAHTASGSCTDLNNDPLSGLDLSGTTHTAAGTYASDTWTINTANYTGSGTIQDTIDPANASCTVTAYSVPYDGSPHSASGSCSGVNGESPSLNLAGTVHTDAGDYPLDAWNVADANYTASGTVHDSISQVATTVTVTCPTADQTYTSLAQTPCTAVVTGPGGVVILNPTPTYTNNINVGTATASYTYAATTNYLTNTGSATFRIVRAPTTTVITCPASAVYTGNQIRPCSATTTGPGLNTVNTPTYTANTNVGTATASYRYNQTQNYLQSNLATGTFLITKAPSTVTVTCPASVGYTGAALTPCTARYFGAGFSVNGVLFTPVTYTNNVGPGVATASATWNGDNNHTGSTGGPVSFRINTAASVTAVANSKIFGAADPVLTYTTSGFSAGDLAGIAFSVTRAAGENAGNYTITPSASGAPLANYTVTYNTATFTISRAQPIATITCPATVPYTGAIQRPCSYTVTGVGGAVIQTNNVPNSGYSPASPRDVGTYTVNYTYAQTQNYLQAVAPAASFQIVQATPTVTVTCPVSVPYTGTAQTPCTAAVTGFAGATFTWVYANNTDVGFASATANFAGNTNYKAGSGTGSFEITGAAVVCTVTPYHVTYDSNPHSATGSCILSTGEDLSAYLNLDGTSHTDAGSYSDTWTFHDTTGTYAEKSGTVNDVIDKADADCDSGFFSFYNGPYTGTPHGAAGKCYGVNGVDLSSQITSTARTDVGIAIVTWTFNGGTNYNNQQGFGLVIISRANATCEISGYVGLYDGAAHGAIGTCKGVLGDDLSANVNLGAKFTNVPGGTANWTFSGNSNYFTQSGSVLISITLAPSTVRVTCPASVPYSGVAQTPCTAVATDATGALNKTLTVNYTNNINAGTATASAEFTGDANHSASSGEATFIISTVNPNCTITPYMVIYDANPHTATGTCLGVLGETLSGLELGGTTHTDAGDYTDPWTFTDSTGNYKDISGTTGDSIGKADATCTVSGYSGVYDASPHGATGSCVGLSGSLSGLDLGNSFSNVPGGTAHWKFSDANYKDQSGDVAIVITKAVASCSVTGYTGVYDAASHGAEGSCSGVGGENPGALDLGEAFKNVPGGTAHWKLTANGNYGDLSGDVAIVISKAAAACAINGYTGIYDAATHGASGACPGVGGENAGTLDLGASFINVPGGTAHWTFSANGNYNDQSGDAAIVINKASVSCNIAPYHVTYDAQAHIASGSCTGVGGAALGGLNLNATTHTDAGDYPGDTWTFSAENGNYLDASGTIHDIISPSAAACSINGYTGDYDGAAHGASGSCTGVGDVTLSGLSLGATFTDVPGGTAHWTFSNPNYIEQSGNAAIVINRRGAACTINGYTGVYDGAAHGASGSCTGVGGLTLSGLNLGATFTNVPGGTAHWTFTNANYLNQSGDETIAINKANATCHISGFHGPYDGAGHGASGSCTGAGGGSLDGLTLGSKFTDVPGGSPHWAFNNANYNTQSGSVDIVIEKAASITSVTCPTSVLVTGAALKPCSAQATSAGLYLELTVYYNNNITIGTAFANSNYAGDNNHVGSSAYTTFYITTLATPTVIAKPGVSKTTNGASILGTATPDLSKANKGNVGIRSDRKGALLAPATPASAAQPTKSSAKAAAGNKKTSKLLPTLSGTFGWIGAAFLGLLVFFMFKRKKDEDEEEEDTSK